MLTRRTLLTVGIFVSSSGSACTDPEPRVCDAFAASVHYDLRFDEISGDCLGPLQHILPERFNTAEATSFRSLSMSTYYAFDKTGCLVSIQVRKVDFDHAAELYIFGEGLVDNASEVRGEVTVALSRIETEAGTTLDPRNAETAPRTPVCETTARATLTRSADNAAAGSGSSH